METTVPPTPLVAPTPPKVSFSRQKLLLIALPILALVTLGSFILLSKNQSSVAPTPSPTPMASASIEIPQDGKYLADELVVKFRLEQSPTEIKDPTRLAKITDVEKQAGTVSKEKLFHNSTDPNLNSFYVYKFQKGTDINKAAAAFQTLPEVEYVEANRIFSVQ